MAEQEHSKSPDDLELFTNWIIYQAHKDDEVYEALDTIIRYSSDKIDLNPLNTSEKMAISRFLDIAINENDWVI